MTQDSNHTIVNGLRAVIVAAMMSLTGSHALADGVVVKGNVYGGGNLADVKTNTEVNMSTGTVEGSVFGGGKGKADNFTCDKAMVGIGTNDDGVTFVSGEGENAVYTLKPGGTTVTITNGTVEGDVYGGGEVGRVERNTIVTIGTAGDDSSTPIIEGHVFGAGKGVETHGYSALVRGNATVTIQGKAQVWQNVHGGGEKASVGRYYVAQNQTDADNYHVRIGMPCYLKAGGKCTVNIQDNATIGKEANTGDVYGAGQGVTPIYNNTEDDKDRSKRMVYKTAEHNDGNRGEFWDYYVDEDGNVNTGFVWEFFATNDDYLQYVETLGRASETDVVIGGKRGTTGESPSITASTNAPTVKGTVYGGSESGFVYYSTAVNMLKGIVNGDVFGGGKGLLSFAEAGRVKRNTNITISNGTIKGNVYGGGSLGDVGTIDKTDKKDGQLTYNYFWKQTDGTNANTAENNKITGTNNNTGICSVTITGGTIGISGTVSSEHGNVFGAGRGTDITWWCEKAIAYATNVSITDGTVNGNLYGGGQVGRVEDDAKVVIGTADATGDRKPTITGSVFGAGAGLHTHGYSALVRGNSDVTVQGTAQVGGSVYGGGEIASVGKFRVDKGLPKEPLSGGYCTVTIQDNAKIGTSGTEHNVYGACKGVDPATISSSERKSMQLFANRPKDANGNYKAENDGWSYYPSNNAFVWVTYTEDDYPAFLRTLALTSHPHVTIAESASVFGSVYGGGQRGITLGNVDVDITGGIVEKDVYGGGALADTNAGNWDADDFTEVTGLTADVSSVTGLYTLSGTTYTIITGEDAKAVSGTTYYSKGKWADATKKTANYTTTVDLTGGHIKGDAYGGGLGQKTGFYDAQNTIAAKDIEAVVWGDINVTLGSNGGSTATSFYTTYDNAGTSETPVQVIKSGRVFGCNNLLGSPQGDVTVTVWRTVAGNGGTQVRTSAEVKAANKDIMDAHPDDYETVSGYVTPTYEVAAVYGGGNLAPYEAAGKKAHVIINGCDATSIQTVYGGGNAAAVPETMVDIYSCYEIGNLFGGGNGKDKYKKGNSWVTNPGANVNGNANTLIYGGTVHEAFGGSNEKGTVTGDVTIDIADGGTGSCTLDVAKLVGAGKNADVNGDLKIIMGCKPSQKVPLVFGGADNANVNGDVELTITSGNWGKVVGGNNAGGCIKGHIILNIEETTCIPINIDQLYLCGNNAAYSQYGYYVKTTKTEGTPVGDPSETPVLTSAGKLDLIPRESATDSHKAVKNYSYNESGVPTWTVYSGEGEDKCEYDAPVLNVISCTSIGEVFGGGYGAGATVYGNPTVNINMIPGAHADEIDRDKDGNADGNANALGTIGDVYGGGDAAAVYGNTTVNIGTITSTSVHTFDLVNGEYKVQYQADGVTPIMETKTVTGAYITGNVYGGGKLADVGKYHEVDDAVVADRKNAVIDLTGNTNVNIGAKLNNSGNWESVAEGTAGVFIGGNVYGGGMGDDTSFFCDAAMVLGNKGTTESSNDANNDGGGTHVRIGNGTINGNVYGGGEIARVERNTEVTIGFGEGVPGTPTTNKPVIMGSVFGAGAGLRTHGYSALVRGHSSVTIEGNAKVMQSVYGGGEMATVGRYQVTNNIAEYNISGGKSTVTIGGYAEIGPNDMVMNNTTTHKPDDYGHVFGAGKGIQPYEGFKDTDQPWSKIPNGEVKYTKFNDLSDDDKLPKAYATYIRTLALTTETDVTIKDHAFVKGCVFGGSENGFVQEDTHVTIQDDCQIGNGYVQMTDDGTYLDKLSTSLTPLAVNRRYTADEWSAGHLIMGANDRQALKDLVSPNNTPTYYTSSLPECASWPYGQAANVADRYAPYDPNYGTSGYDSKGGRTTADDGHTFYGSVFGGGSGYYPYKPGRWFVDAGAVYGNTRVDITGGHILTSVYGGNELTNVGKYQLDSDGKPTTIIQSGGKCTVNFGGTATLGVPRTLKQISAHPVTCYLFGAGKGDQRVLFNKSTNVGDVEVNITGGTIYGSVFGGGEDGHVMRDVKVTIDSRTETVPPAVEGEDPTTTTITPTIGTWGTSYVDGNVFGGGRGFSGEAYTAGNVAGSIKMEIKGGNILGSIYGGGRLGSVGYGLYDELTDGNPTPGYGEMRDDDKMDDGTDGTSFFTKGRGHIDITISGGTIGNNREYIIPNATNMAAAGIPEEDRDISKWDDDNKYWDIWKEYHKIPKTEFDPTTGQLTHTKGGNVFAGGMGNFYKQDGSTYINDVNWWQLGCVKSTKLTITGGNIKSNVYGGGELGQVVGHHTTDNVNLGSEITIQGSNTVIGTEVKDGSNVVQYTFGSVFGGGYGSLVEKIEVQRGTTITSYPKYIAGRVKAGTKVNMTAGSVLASVYGGGEMAAVGESKTLGETLTTGFTGDTYVTISGGIIGKEKVGSTYFGGAKMGNVYGGGSGNNNTVRSGHVYGNTNVTISAGSVSGEPKIYHNVYGGGAYGSVGDFTYQTGTDAQTGTQKVIGISGLNKNHSNSGVARVTITGGTIGYDGKENGMVFGSSRGDINEPGKRDDHTAWVYNANVIIGTAATPASGTPDTEGYVAATPASGPDIKGSVYGSGENGHTFNNTVVTVNGGIIGIDDENDDGFTVTSNDTSYSGAAYPYRGNVYGGGCGTDKYYLGSIPTGHTYNDGEGDYYNPLAGIVYGTTRVDINGGTVVRNVYGAGAMGSVGKTTWTTETTEVNGVQTTTKTAATTTGGLTTINVNGGIIGVSGTVGDGNVFGAARGSKDVVQADRDDLSRVRETNVTVSAGEVRGNVYGGGELGDVGTIVKNTTSYNYTWVKEDNSGSNVAGNNVPSGSSHDTSKNTGICNVTITGGTIGSATAGTGNVFGGGKGDANTWWCEKATAFATNVNVRETSGSTTKVYGTVYGGGEIGRVEDDTKVIIGTENGSDTPEINGNVFGAGKGLATRGYSALVRGNSIVTVQGNALVEGNVFGGGEEASLGRFNLVGGLPKTPQSGGSSIVTIQDNAKIGSSGTGNHVYGAGQGVTPNYVGDYKNFKSMQLEKNKPSGDEGDTWDYYVDDDGNTSSDFVWVYYKTKEEYLDFLKTLALASHPTVTIAENATVYGDVYGGGQRGITLGDVTVNITGGTVKQDVYGAGSLADTNKGNWDDDRYVAATVAAGASVAGLYTVTGNDTNGNPVYAPTSADATADGSTTYYRKGTWAEGKYTTTHETTYKTNVTLTGGEIDRNVYGGGLGQLAKAAVAEQPAQGTEGQEGYVPAVPAQAAVSAVEAKVYGDVLVELNKPTSTTTGEGESATTTTYGDCEVKGTIFGCNNLNGSPQSGVTVHVYKTVTKGAQGTENAKPTKNSNTYEMTGVYGGGNLAAYYPDDLTTRGIAKTNVIIDGCGLTSIKSVYGGGNAASVPATEVVVNGTYEIGEAFGGGNGKDDISYDGTNYVTNPGANVGYRAYPEGTNLDGRASYAYGIGKAHITIYGGTVHTVYGGSNLRGNVRVESRTTLEEVGECDFAVGDAYGGGNNADQDGDAVLEAGCIQGLDIAYGGASNADVNGDVKLNITNGTYGRVFGGNNLGGVIRGTITVNIEETGCRPIVIGQLYGGGNLASYTVENISRSREDLNFTDPTAENYYKNFPKVNVKSFTSIGTIFGGGFGIPAELEGNPQVNVNVYEGKYYNTFKGNENVINENAKVVGTSVKYSGTGYDSGYPIPYHKKGAIGAINDVFGGGNLAKVIGNPTVNIGTEAGEEVYVAVEVKEGEELKGYCTRTGEGTTESPYQYSELTEGTAPNTAIYYLKTVKAVDIRGNVFGGGNNAVVTGNTEVVIGKKKIND